MTNTTKRTFNYDALAFAALQGLVVPVPCAGLEPILNAFPSLGGLDIPNGKELASRALQYSDKASRVTYVTVNTIAPYDDSQVMISMVVSTPDYPVHTLDELCDPQGVLAYVYNVTYPDLSELGYIGIERDKHGHVRRVW